MTKIKPILIVALLIASGIAALAASPSLRKMLLPAAKQPPAAPAIVMPEYDAAADSLFAGLAELYNKVGQLQTFSMEGNIRLIDQADTTLSINTRFRYCQKDSLRYYQLGNQEMLTIPGLYLSVDHSIRKIMMSPNAQQSAAVMPLVGAAQIEELKKEGYYISRERMDNYNVIRLRRDKHVSCRELRVSFDSAGMIRQTYMRKTDMDDPADPSLDKLISVNISHWQTANVPLQVFSAGRFIRRQGESWAPAAAFRDYEIKYIY